MLLSRSRADRSARRRAGVPGVPPALQLYTAGGGFYKPSFVVFVVGGPGNNVARHISSFIIVQGWLGSRVVSELDSGAEGPGFKSQPRRCRITVLGKLFTPIVLLFTKQRNW